MPEQIVVGSLLYFKSFIKWKAQAEKIGWVHCHDDIVVCDYENGCAGEFDASEGGWLLKELCD